jgi:hypothetical protein
LVKADVDWKDYLENNEFNRIIEKYKEIESN